MSTLLSEGPRPVGIAKEPAMLAMAIKRLLEPIMLIFVEVFVLREDVVLVVSSYFQRQAPSTTLYAISPS
jgi:hypothetical protein